MEIEPELVKYFELLGDETGDNFKSEPVVFVYKKGNKYIAVDNSTFDCWVEEFNSECDAQLWIENDLIVDENLYDDYYDFLENTGYCPDKNYIPTLKNIKI